MLVFKLSLFVLAIALSIWSFVSDGNAWTATGIFFLSYFLLAVLTLPLSKSLGLSTKAKFALELLARDNRGYRRISKKKSDTVGIGSIAGVPYYLAAAFDDVGVNISILYDPVVRPRNIHLQWESIKAVWLDEHELVLSLQADPSVELRMPRAFGGKYPKSLSLMLEVHHEN